MLILLLFFLFTSFRGLPMRTTWLYTNTSMRWHWNLDQPGQTLSLLQVSLCDTQLCSYSLWNILSQHSGEDSLAGMLQYQCVPTWISLFALFFFSQSQEKQPRRQINDFVSAFSAKCENVTFNIYFCSFLFARPDTYSHALPKELRGGWSVQWAGQLLRTRRRWQESKELCKKDLVLMLF